MFFLVHYYIEIRVKNLTFRRFFYWDYRLSFYGFIHFSKAGVKLFETIPEELSGCWVLMNIYYTPFTFLDFLFGLPNIPIISLLRNIVPTILMGLGLKYKRLKYKYR